MAPQSGVVAKYDAKRVLMEMDVCMGKQISMDVYSRHSLLFNLCKCHGIVDPLLFDKGIEWKQ